MTATNFTRHLGVLLDQQNRDALLVQLADDGEDLLDELRGTDGWTAAVLEMREKGGVRKPDMSRAGVFFPGETGKKDGKQKLGFAERRPRLCIRKK